MAKASATLWGKDLLPQMTWAGKDFPSQNWSCWFKPLEIHVLYQLLLKICNKQVFLGFGFFFLQRIFSLVIFVVDQGGFCTDASSGHVLYCRWREDVSAFLTMFQDLAQVSFALKCVPMKSEN